MKKSTNVQKKDTNDILFSILNDITATRSVSELLEIIYSKLKNIIDVDDVGLFHVLEDGRHRDLTAASELTFGAKKKINQFLGRDWLPSEPSFNATLKKCLIQDFEDFFDQYPEHPHFQFLKDEGLKQFISTPLIKDKKVFGMFLLWSKTENTYTKKDEPLFLKVADMIAVALSNILDREALLAEKNFKEALLNISENVSNIHNRRQLLNLLIDKVKTVIPFDNSGLFILDNEKDIFYELVTDSAENILDDVADAIPENFYGPFKYSGNHKNTWIYTKEIGIFDVKKQSKIYKNPQWDYMLSFGLKKILVVPLYYAAERIGFLCLNSVAEDLYKTEIFPLLNSIANQVAIAIHNVLTNEKLLEEKKFKETLLTITSTLSTVSTGQFLIRTILDDIKDIFNFYDIGLFVFAENRMYLEDWAVKYEVLNLSDGSIKMSQSEKVNTRLQVAKGSNLEWELEMLKKAKGPTIIDLTEMAGDFPDYEQSEIIISTGYRDSMQTLLKYGGETLGFFCINALQKDFFNKSQFSLFQAIADQIAIAVSNIKSSETLIVEKNFKETLLAISEAVASIQDRKELFKVIFEKINPVIPIDDVGLLILDESGTRWKDLAIVDNYNQTAGGDELAKLGYIDFLPLDKLTRLSITEIGIMTIFEMKKNYGENPFIPIMEKDGLKEFLFTPLKVGNQTIGSIFFDSRKEGVYTKEMFPLFKAIADQLAVAVSNVLANEKLITEKEFSTTLLHITEAVAQVKDVKDLYRTIFKHIKPVFPYDELGLFVVDEADDSHYELISASDLDQAIVQKLIEKNLGANQKFKHSGTSVEWLMEKGPLAIDIEEIDKVVPHPQHQFMLEGGLKNIIGGPLSIGGKPFGMVCFNSTISNFYNEEHLILFKSIAEQISVAVSNILSRQQLIEREQEKTTLLDITSAVSKIRNLPDFLNFVMTKLQPIFKFYDVGVFLVTNDGEHHFDVASTPTKIEEASSLNYFSNVDDTLIPHKDSAIKWAIEKIESENKPVLFDFKDLAKQFPDYYQFEAYDFVGEGYRDCLAANLKVGDDILGMFCINALEKDVFKKEQFSLFQNVTEQLSVAVSNILANNNIVEREQEKATLLEITSAVSKIRNLPDFLSFVTKKLKPIFNFVDVGIFLVSEDGEYHYDMAGHDEEVSKSPINEALLADGNKSIVHKGSLIEWMMNQIKKEEGPILFDFVQLVNDFPDYYQFTIVDMSESGYRDCLAAKLKIGDTVFGMFCINALEKDFFKKEQFSLFQNVTEQLSVAVSNILANEQLLEEKKLKETLLEVSEAINSIRNKKELYDTIMTILQPHLGFADAVLCIVDEELGTHIHPLTAAPETTIEHPLYKAVVENHLLTKGSPMEAILLGDDVNEMLLVDWLERFPTYPGFLLMKDVGLQYSFTLKLKNQNKNIGIWFFHFTEPQILDDFKIKLYTNLRNQISIALTNILAQESVEKEQEYSETLLEITEALAVAEDALQLHNAIHTVVRKLIPFDKVEVLVLDKSGEYHYELINEAYVNSVAGSNHIHTDFARQTLYELAGTPVDWFTNNGPDIVTMDFLAKHTFCVLHNEQRKKGIKEVIGGPLKNQGKIIGMLAFKLKEEGVFNQQHVKHYKSVAEQVSICLANILSKKEILWKSAVQELEIKLSNILTEDHTTIDKWGSIFQEFKKCIPFSLAMVLKVEEGKIKRYVYEFITPKEKRQLTMEDVMEISKLSEKEFIEAERALYKASSKKSNFFDKSTDLPIPASKLLEALDLHSTILDRIVIKSKNTEIVYFLFSKEPKQYSIRHSNILKGIRNTMRISLENMLSSFSIKEMSEQLQLEKTYLESVVKETYNFEHMIGESDAIRAVFNQITEVASVDATTLLLGETGTGKELIARAIHENSTRKDRVLVKVNCAAIPSQIVESELFGHKKGAFTGAIQDRIGKFELANNGTIFLDEIGEMPLELQTKLLRVIQEREVERLGSNEIIKLNIRIIAATNKDLLEEIENGKFRADLYYRLNSFPIMVPPLKARDGDVLLLSDYFARQFSERYGLPFKGFTANSLSRLKRYDWPGNVRELQNLMEQAIISQRGKVLEVYPGSAGVSNLSWNDSSSSTSSSLVIPEEFNMDTIKLEKDKLERAFILQALEKTNWRVSGKNGAARLLDVASTTLESKMKKLGIKRNTI